MTTFWPVPYVGQVGTGANLHGNDCGPTCVAMILKWAGVACPTVDILFDEVQPNGDSYTSFGDLMGLLSRRGINPDYDGNVTTKDLFWYLVSGVPVIALISYGALETIRPNKFKGNHFVVITGMDLNTIYINDPLNSVASGENIAVPMKMFENAWSTAIDSVRSIIIPSVATYIPPILRYVTPRDVNGINVRKIPGDLSYSNKLYAIKYGVTIPIYFERDGWGKIKPSQEEWISLEFVK